MTAQENIYWIAFLILILFTVHNFLIVPKGPEPDDDIVIDSRLLGERDEDLTNPHRIAFLVYKTIALDLKKRVEILEMETSKLKHFRTVFGFYIAAIGFSLGLFSAYLKIFGGSR
jgi:hypothetical protein